MGLRTIKWGSFMLGFTVLPIAMVLPSCKHPSLEHSFIGHDAINDSNGTLHIVLLHHNRPADPLGLLRQVLKQLSYEVHFEMIVNYYVKTSSLNLFGML